MPAIDIRGGRVVRLVRGRPEQTTVYADDPAEVAGRYVADGAEWLHVVDLDAALGAGSNRDVVRRIAGSVGAWIQVGGGLRSLEAAADAVSAGAERVVLGTLPVRNPELLSAAVDRLGDRVVVAVDVDADEVRVDGWTHSAGKLEEVVPRLEAAGAPRFMATSIARDGTLEGPDVALYERLGRITERPVVASGGVRAAHDLRSLASTGVEAAIVGTALYEGTLTLAEALEAAGAGS